MIDVLSTIFTNYELLDLQIEHWKKFSGDFRLIFCDSTPLNQRKDISHLNSDKIKILTLDTNGIDGEIHGRSLDYLVQEATSDIVCIMDSDFFWLDYSIIEKVEVLFSHYGYENIGAAAYYLDYQRICDRQLPELAGNLAPNIFGMFIKRDLALAETFVVTADEGRKFYPTGWKNRLKIINEDRKRLTFQGVGFSELSDDNLCYFKDNSNKLVGFHLLKGSSYRSILTPKILEYIKFAEDKNAECN